MTEGNGELPKLAPGTVRLVIDYNPQTGEVGLGGNLDPTAMPTMFLGMIETAKMLMFEQRAQEESAAALRRVLPASEIPGQIPNAGSNLVDMLNRR